jgi:hypothetical protein
MNNYLFDVKLFVTLRLDANSEAEARTMLMAALADATVNCGALPDGSPLVGEASLDDDAPDLIEINGEDPDSFEDED